jgi:predicted CDP-diglyceride synthetase/phosphatidate cytidylyltransferase
MDELEQQVKVSKMLGMGFVLSITGIMGIGSLIALVLGWKALRTIRASNGRIGGRLMAWWCIVAGALGAVFIPAAIITAILRQLNDSGR